MATMTHDTTTLGGGSSTVPGLGLAVLSAFSFGLSGSLAKGLLETGWTAGAAVTARIVIAAAVLAVPAALALRGRWGLLVGNLPTVLAYGLVAIAGCQLAYFSAVEYLQVGVALLIEYTAPVLVIGWMWLRHGHRPGLVTLAGAALAAGGLVLVLDLVSGADLDALGVAWALGATVGAAVYFILSAGVGNGLPPIVLAGAGLVVGAVALLAAGALGFVAMSWSTSPASYDGTEVAWWLPVLGLALVTCALAYLTGIGAARRLGSRLASFVALLEVFFAVLAAWLLLDELPRAVQFVGGLLILAGVVVVKLGERRTTRGRVSAPPAVARTPRG